MEKKINIGQKAKVEITWNTAMATTKEEQKNIKTAFARKYGIPESNISVKINRTNVKSKDDSCYNAENIKNIHDPVFMQQLFKQYIAINGIEDYDMDAIIKIDSMINSMIDFNSYQKSKRYSVKWLDWSNFLSYGANNHFDFTQLNGLVLLNGQPANKCGKSTFAYDLLHFLFFGKTKSGKADTLGELFNSFLPNETELKVEGCINIEGNDYIIKRTLTRPSKSKKAIRTASQKVQYYRVYENGESVELEDTDNLQEASAKETSKVIKEAIGNESDYDLIISANAKDLDELISLKEDARGKILSRWIGLSILEDKDAKAREKWNKQISVGRMCDIYNRETLKTDISNMETDNKERNAVIDTENDKIESSTKKIESYRKDKELAIMSKRPVNQELINAGDTTTLEAKRDRIIEDGKRKKAQLPEMEKRVNSFGDTDYSEDEYKKLQSEKENIIGKIAGIKAEINNLKNTNANLASAEYCPVCKRKLDNVDNSGLIKTNETKIQALINEGIKLNNRKAEIEPLMSAIDVKREQTREKNKLEIQLAALNTEIANLRNDYKEICALLQARKDNMEAIKLNDELDAKINAIDASIRVEDEIINTARMRVNTESNIISQNNNRISEKRGIIVKIEEELKIEKDWKLYLKMIGKDGISKIVLKNTLPIINSELNNLLGDVTDFEIEIEVNDKNDVEFWLIRDNVRYRLAGASGLERTQAALALRVVLGNMSMLSKPPFILLDEILGTVDAQFYDDMKRLYDKIVNNFDFVIHICHLADWVENHNQIITVTKENNISSIQTKTV